MANLPEIMRLFSKLASDLEPSDPPSDGLSSLVASLNSDDADASGTRVLDAALSLMCFNSTEVFSSRIKCLLGTIISALSASASFHFQLRGFCSDVANPGFATVGSLISYNDCCQIIRLCGDVIERLKGHCEEDILHALSHAILKLAVSTSPFKEGKELISSDSEMRSIISQLKHNLPEETFPNKTEIPSRVFLWYLDPSILKSEISDILNEATHRPFICLRNEMHDRTAWRVLILCLISSPFAFMEIRSLLHYWFLETGFDNILELQIAIVCSILDVLLRPTRWGVQADMGLNYPSMYTYVPDNNRELLAILTGPISCATFLDLFSCVNSQTEHEALAETVDCNSSWALVINFPNWYFFATAILFHRDASGEYISKFIHGEIFSESIDKTKLLSAVCQYIAWISYPVEKSKFTSLAKQLSLLSESCVRNVKATSRRPSNITRSKNLRISKVHEFEKPSLTTWLKEFQRQCFDKNLLYNRIPLGILISSLDSLDQSESELLLHFATTGDILDPRNTSTVFLRNNSVSKRQAIDGARFVLNLLDSIEELSMYIFKCDDARLLYLSRLRGKTGVYLFRCVKFLLELKNLDRGNMAELYARLVRWKDSGALHGCYEFESVLSGIRLKYCL
ncbi:acyl-CoA synthetase family protein [Rhynchospora pubera]|uniref:Acyl-CoA synthetase family protein n=1 Tax=Rhynchospora pubera TaxID=906938 RepID=A0AAV8CN20_9POAL|nr:acyl-CoA synthetase family protein [Rhynchospora pubera]